MPRPSGLTDVGTLAALVADASEVVDLDLPARARRDGCADVRAAGFAGVFVDANAISPATAERIAPTVDGGVIGGPPRVAGTTRLYLSGSGRGRCGGAVRRLALDARVLDDQIGTASALKMAYAAYTKGLAALLHRAARDRTARTASTSTSLDEWAISQPDLAAISELAAANAAPKAWRWIAEMEEIAATFAAAGQPDGFHRAAADVYRRWPADDDSSR